MSQKKCPREENHESIKQGHTAGIPRGIQEFGPGIPSLFLVNCPHCHTTLSLYAEVQS